jgi:hypothetical protein
VPSDVPSHNVGPLKTVQQLTKQVTNPPIENLKNSIRNQRARARPTNSILGIKIPPYSRQRNTDARLVHKAGKVRYSECGKDDDEFLPGKQISLVEDGGFGGLLPGPYRVLRRHSALKVLQQMLMVGVIKPRRLPFSVALTANECRGQWKEI